jgi:hypothetical protein
MRLNGQHQPRPTICNVTSRRSGIIDDSSERTYESPWKKSEDHGFIRAVYNPAPVVASVTGVGLSGSGPCKVNQSCQLVINGIGFMFDTAYLIKETNATLGYQSHGSTPTPWTTVTTDFFSVAAAGQYTVRVTNTNTSGGSTSVEAIFSVTN